MLTTAKVVGINSDTEAALALICRSNTSVRNEGETKQAEPDLYILVSCSGEDAFTKTRQALAQAEDVFYSLSQSCSARLSETLASLKESLKSTENLQILLAATQKEDLASRVLYLLPEGGLIQAFLIRDGQWGNLTQMGNSSELVSGFLGEGDRVVMATDGLKGVLGEGFADLATLSMEVLEDEILARLPQDQIFPVAAIVIEETVKEKIKETSFEVRSSEVEKKIRLSINFSQIGYMVGRIILKLVPRSKRKLGFLGLVLLIVVLAGVGFSFKNKKEAQVTSSFNEHYQKAFEEYQKSLALKDADPVTAVSSLALSRDLLAKALEISPVDKKALDLKKQIEDSSDTILKIYHPEDLSLWLDLDLVKKGFSSSRLSLSLGKLLILDQSSGTLIVIDMNSKSNQILAGSEQLGKALFASLNGHTGFVFSEDKGILKIDLTEGSKARVVVKTDSEWGEILDIFGYAGNIYLLDQGKNEVWKYIGVTDGYSDKRHYLKEDTKTDFSGSLRMEIDSSVWVLKKNSEILKFTQGGTDFFALAGLDQPAKDSKSFYVADKTDNLYLLDNQNERMIILDKKGVYLGQYKSAKLANVSDLVVDEANKKAYFLDGSKIYQLDLR